MAGVFDAVEKLKRIYTYYNPVNNHYPKYKGSLLAEYNDPQKDETRMDRFYNLIDSINSNTEQIKESSTENGKRSKYEDVYFQVPTVEETESETREEPEKTEKSEEVVPNSPSPNIDKPIKVVDKGKENVGNKQNLSSFYNDMKQRYENALSQKGIDKSYASMLAAQDVLESRGKPSGKNNYGGIKGNGPLLNTREWINGEMREVKRNFRDFNSIDDYINYKINLLNSSRYHAFDGSDFVNRVVSGGYATSPQYEKTLRNIIRQYNSQA